MYEIAHDIHRYVGDSQTIKPPQSPVKKVFDKSAGGLFAAGAKFTKTISLDSVVKKQETLFNVACIVGFGEITGLIACCYLLQTGTWFTAKEALRYYSVTRTKNQRGVSVPSWRRYVGYYEYFRKMVLLNQRFATDSVYVIELIIVEGRVKKFNKAIVKNISNGKSMRCRYVPVVSTDENDVMYMKPIREMRVYKDVRIEFVNRVLYLRDELVFCLSINTDFIGEDDETELVFEKDDLDKINLDYSVTSEFTVKLKMRRLSDTTQLDEGADVLLSDLIDNDVEEHKLQTDAQNAEFKARAKNVYVAVKNDELNLEVDEVYDITHKAPSGWWYARNDAGQSGWVPSNCLTTNPALVNQVSTASNLEA